MQRRTPIILVKCFTPATRLCRCCGTASLNNIAIKSLLLCVSQYAEQKSCLETARVVSTLFAEIWRQNTSTLHAHPPEPELPSAIQFFFKYNSYQTKCFFEALDSNSNLWIVPIWEEFQTNHKLSSKSNYYVMNEPSTQRANWRCHFSVGYLRNNGQVLTTLLVHCYVT